MASSTIYYYVYVVWLKWLCPMLNTKIKNHSYQQKWQAIYVYVFTAVIKMYDSCMHDCWLPLIWLLHLCCCCRSSSCCCSCYCYCCCGCYSVGHKAFKLSLLPGKPRRFSLPTTEPQSSCPGGKYFIAVTTFPVNKVNIHQISEMDGWNAWNSWHIFVWRMEWNIQPNTVREIRQSDRILRELFH